MPNDLRYRRQFILTNNLSTDFQGWNRFTIGKYYLHAHPDLPVSENKTEGKHIVILGNIYDFEFPKKNNTNILDDIIDKLVSLQDLIARLKKFSGRYAVIYKDDLKMVLLPDALALREIYYCERKNFVICGSQPNLLADFSQPRLHGSKNDELIEFHNLHQRNGKWDPEIKWFGDKTYFEYIRHLLPNHYFDLIDLKAKRFWPDRTIQKVNLEDAVIESCKILRGNLGAMVHRHSVMMAVTSGTDSRLLLAASKNFTDRIYYFINDEKLGIKHPDIYVPKNIFHDLDIPFHVHDIEYDVDGGFREIFLGNTYFASERILPTIYNVYYKKHSEKVNILGIGEIGRTRYGKEPKNINSFLLAYKMGHGDSKYAVNQCERIMKDMIPAYQEHGVNFMTGFYWEQILGNWGTTGNSESDIAIEEVNPFNCYKLYEIFLGVDERYTRYEDNILFKAMIEAMWCDLMRYPLNPPHKISGRIKKILRRVGLLGVIRYFQYGIGYLTHVKTKRRWTQS